MRSACASLLVVLAACAGGEPPPLRVEVAATEAGLTRLQGPELERRTLAASAIAARQWGGTDLEGWTVRFVSDIDRCGDLASADRAIKGCTDPERQTIDVSIDATTACVEGTALLHEIGHVALPGDQAHSDARWSSGKFWYEMLGAVEAEIRQTDSACADEIAAWREWWAAR